MAIYAQRWVNQTTPSPSLGKEGNCLWLFTRNGG